MKTTILEKRTAEDIWYDIDCTPDLNASETITQVISVQADEAGLTFGTPQVNTAIINYKDGSTADVGKVIMVKIAGGAIQAGATSMLYTIRAWYRTNQGNNKREATVQLLVKDKVG